MLEASQLPRRPFSLGWLMLALFTHAACQRCDSVYLTTQCGSRGITEAACAARNCCFRPPPSDLDLPSCYYPADRKADSYPVDEQQLGDTLDFMALPSSPGSATPTACDWSTAVLEPAPAPSSLGIPWMQQHWIQVMEMRTADELGGFDLLLYGDSTTETWRGTAAGLPWGVQNPQVFQALGYASWDMRAVLWNAFASQYKTGVMAIAGDHIGNLWWRLLNGHLPISHPPKVAVVLIGINEINNMDVCTGNPAALAAAVANMTASVASMLALMRQRMPQTHIVLEGLLPRADMGLYGLGADTPWPNNWAWPNIYTLPISAVNLSYQKLAQSDPLMHFLYCGDSFLTASGDGIVRATMADGIHPTAAGLALLAQCLQPLLQTLIPSNSSAVGSGAKLHSFF